MKRIWQVMILVGLLGLATSALRAEEAPAFKWEPLKIQNSLFSPDIGLLNAERDEYASHLTECAVVTVHQGKASAQALAAARRMLALALHLSPRNRRAIVANFQLAKGLLPAVSKGDFTPPSMARLLTTRGQILAKSEDPENQLLARMFRALAAELDPQNEDAIYASEVDALDHGPIDWSVLTNPRPPAKPAPPPESSPPPAGRPAPRSPRPGN
jgi:hypothetical protein